MTAAPTVRVAGSADLGAALAVHAAHERPDEPPTAPTDLEHETWDRMMRTPDLRVYLAEVGGEAVGTATTIAMPNVTYACAPTLFIEAVVVVPAFRRRGIARAMLQRVLADARTAGCDKIQVLSHKRHATDGAHALYDDLGFAAEAEGFRLYLRRDAEGSTGG